MVEQVYIICYFLRKGRLWERMCPHRFCLWICLHAKIFCNPKVSTEGAFTGIYELQKLHVQSGGKTLIYLLYTVPDEVNYGDVVHSCFHSWNRADKFRENFSFHIVNNVCFTVYAIFFKFLLFLVTWLFKMAPKHNAKWYLVFLSSRRP